MTTQKVTFNNIEEAQAKGYVGEHGVLMADKISLILPNPDTFMSDSEPNGGSVYYSQITHSQSFLMLNDADVAGPSL